MRDFFIKQGSTFPELTYSVDPQIFDKYSIDKEYLNYAVGTFSMVKSNGLFMIANNPAEFIINTDPYKISAEGKYVLKYGFKEHETSELGKFLGEFRLDFIHPEYKNNLTLPTYGEINIYVGGSITKTTVIF